MVHQVGIDHILQVSAPVIWQQDVDCLVLSLAASFCRDAVVDVVDDSRRVAEELVGFYFVHGLGDGFLAERASDLFEREQFACGCVLHQVDVGEAALDRKKWLVQLGARDGN